METYIINRSLSGFRGTRKSNYYSRIQDANKIAEFNFCDGFETFEDVIEYVVNYFGLSIEEIEVVK